MVQQIVHKVIVNGEDISHHVSNISVTSMEMDSYPVGKIQLANPIGIYTANPDKSPMYRRNDVEIWASKDGGASYIRLLDGVITQPNATVSASGQSTMTLECIGGKNLDQMVISPNCAVIGARENIGDVFKGRATDVRGVAWTADVDGNYPDGLLYKTGYEYDGVSSLFDDDWDFPSNYSTGTYNIYNTIKNICKLYGLVFFIDDNNSKVTVLRKPSVTAFDQTTAFSFERGRNIEGVKDDSDQRRKYDKVVVIGSGVHAMVGSGLRTYVHNDSEISDYSTAVAVANSMAATMIQTSEDPKWHETKITTGPVTAQIVGKSILVKDKMFLDEPTWRNCVGVSHTIANGRWTSEVSLESSSFTVGKTLAEVIEEAGEADTTSGIAFLSAFDPEIDSDVLAYNCTPGAIMFGKQSDDNYYLDLLGNTFVGSDGKVMSLNYLTSGNYNERMDEISIIFNDYGYLPVNVVEDGTMYTSYTGAGSSIVTDGGDHVIITSAFAGSAKIKPISFTPGLISLDMYLRIDVESDVTQNLPIRFNHPTSQNSYIQIPVVANVRKKHIVKLSNMYRSPGFSWDSVTDMYFNPSVSCVLKVYNVEIGTVDIHADTIGQTESIEEEFSVNMLPSTRTIYTDASERNWLKLGTLSKNYPYQITAVFADGYSPNGEPDPVSDPYLHQWLKPQDADVVGYYEGIVDYTSAIPLSIWEPLKSVLPAYNSISWDAKLITADEINKISTFDDRLRGIEAVSDYSQGGYTAVMMSFETGFGSVINQSVNNFRISAVMKKSASNGSPDFEIAVWNFNGSSWDSSDEILSYISESNEADGADGFYHYRFNSGFSLSTKKFISDEGKMFIALCVRNFVNGTPADVDWEIKYVDVRLRYDVTKFIQSNIYTVIEPVSFRCTNVVGINNTLGSPSISYWEGNTSFSMNTLNAINSSAEWNDVKGIYENPSGTYIATPKIGEQSGNRTIYGVARVNTAPLFNLLGQNYVARVGDEIIQYVTYTVKMDKRLDLPTVQNVPPTKILSMVNPSDATKQDIYLRLDALAPSDLTLLSVYYDYVGGEIGATFVPSSTGRIDQGIDMGVSKTVNVQTRLDLTKTDVSPEPGVIDGLGCDAVVVAP